MVVDGFSIVLDEEDEESWLSLVGRCMLFIPNKVRSWWVASWRANTSLILEEGSAGASESLCTTVSILAHKSCIKAMLSG